jgi:outer membrane receptor protein involved in Fe transport
LCLVAAVSQADEPLRRFDIPTATASEGLVLFAEQSGIPLIYPHESVRDRQTNRVVGKYTASEALRLLLNGTGIDGSINERRVLTVTVSERGNDGGSEMKVQPEANSEKTSPLAGIIAAFAGILAIDANADQAVENEAEPTRLGEILVTATKREQRLQDVPMSIAVVTREDIDRRGLVHAEDYLRGIPGVHQADDAFGQTITIRGIESSPSYQNFFSGTTVATYFGETPTTSSAGLSGGTNVDLKLVDVERVEVLRGPQGTAFGNSSMGGAVRTIPVAPELGILDGKASAYYSATSDFGGDNVMGQAVANLPLGERVALRAVAYLFDDSGYYRNRAGSDPDFLAAVAPYGAESYASDRDDVGAHSVDGWRLSALVQATDQLRFTLSYTAQDSETDGIPLANNGIFGQVALEIAPENVHRGQVNGFLDNQIDIVNAVAEFDSTIGTVVATYSYVEGGSTSAGSYSLNYPVFVWPLSQRAISEQQGHLGELRFTSRLEGAWNYLAGLYSERLEDDYSDLYYWTGDPDTNFFAPGEFYSGGILEDHRVLRQNAAFGEVSWEFATRFTLTGGARAYDYDRSARYVTDGLFGVGTSDVSNDASGTSFRGSLSYEPAEDAIVYAGWSQGFRLGKPQPGLPAALCDVDGDGLIDGTDVTLESTTFVNSDEVDNYELGSKFLLLDRRLSIDATLFYMDWQGMPVTVGLTSGTCPLGYTANAGAARSKGIEFQSRLLITDQFSISAGGSWVDAQFTEDVPTAGIESGKRLPGSPEVNANLGLEYDFTISRHDAFVRVDATYVGKLYGTISNQTEAVEAGDYVELDASARISFGKLAVDLFVRNLTNEDAFTFRSTQEFIGEYYGYRLRPRTVGLQLSYNF